MKRIKHILLAIAMLSMMPHMLNAVIFKTQEGAQHTVELETAKKLLGLGDNPDINKDSIIQQTKNVPLAGLKKFIADYLGLTNDLEGYQKKLDTADIAMLTKIYQLSEALKFEDEYKKPITKALRQNILTPQDITTIGLKHFQGVDELFKKDIFEEDFITSDPTITEWLWLSPKNSINSAGSVRKESIKVLDENLTQAAMDIYPDEKPSFVGINEEQQIISTYPKNEQIIIVDPSNNNYLKLTDISISIAAFNYNTVREEIIVVNQAGNLYAIPTFLNKDKAIKENREFKDFKSKKNLGNITTQLAMKYKQGKNFTEYNKALHIDAITWAAENKFFISMRGNLIGLVEIINNKAKFIGKIVALPNRGDIKSESPGPELLLDFKANNENTGGQLAIALKDTVQRDKLAALLNITTLDETWADNITQKQTSSEFENDEKNPVHRIKLPDLVTQSPNVHPLTLSLMGVVRGFIEDVKINPRGNEVAIGWENGTIELHTFEPQPKSKKPKETVKLYRGIGRATEAAFQKVFGKKGMQRKSQTSIAYSPSGYFLLASRPLSGKAHIYSTLTDKDALVVRIPNPNEDDNIYGVAWQGDMIALATNKNVYTWDYKQPLNKLIDDNIINNITLDGARALKYMFLNNLIRRKDLPNSVVPLFDALPDEIKAFFMINRDDYKQMKHEKIKEQAEKNNAIKEKYQKTLKKQNEDE